MPTVLDRTKRPAPGWRRNSDRQVTKKPARWKEAGPPGRKPACRSNLDQRHVRQPASEVEFSSAVLLLLTAYCLLLLSGSADVHSSLNHWFIESLNQWIIGSMDQWINGSMTQWILLFTRSLFCEIDDAMVADNIHGSSSSEAKFSGPTRRATQRLCGCANVFIL